MSAKTLLPPGFEDLIAPEAGFAHQLLVDLLTLFNGFDYTLVTPPLLEYEQSLISAPDAPKSQDIFRFMDPMSHHTVGLRGDITLQVVRLAKDHLTDAPRPLRLAYYGHVLRLATTPLRPQRQFMQIGLEQIGGVAHAEVEVLQVALEGLSRIGIRMLCVDFILPTITRRYLSHLWPEQQKLFDARNISGLKQQIRAQNLNPEIGAILEFLLLLPPDPAAALKRLKAHDAFHDDAALFSKLENTIAEIQQSHPDVHLSLDMIEQYGFAYKTGLAYSLYAKGLNTILGRGGRYEANGEAACGVSLNVNNLLARYAPTMKTKRLLLPYNTHYTTIRRLQDEGWAVVFGDFKTTRIESHTPRHYLAGSEIRPINEFSDSEHQ